MGKITKAATARHQPTLSPAISKFVKVTTVIPLHQLPAHLKSFPRQWPFPRGDLYHWIPALDRFDHILELFAKEYELDSGPQTQPFQRRLLLRGDKDVNDSADHQAAPSHDTLDELGFSLEGDSELIEQILSFTRLLLENCGNRSLYASSSHLNHLLNTTSLSLLKTTLHLSYRLAQKYLAARQRMASPSWSNILANHYNIHLDNVLKIASPFTKVSTPVPSLSGLGSKGKEKVPGSQQSNKHPADLVSILNDEDNDSAQWEEWGNVSLSYYESPASAENGAKSGTLEQSAPNSPGTPTPVRRSSHIGPHHTPKQSRISGSEDSPTTPRQQESLRPTGPKAKEIPFTLVSTQPDYELVRQNITDLPRDSHYDLLHRIRVARALTTNKATREDIVAIRLLAIANLAYVNSESVFQQKISQQDSDEPRRLQLAYQLAELVHPPGNGRTGISRELQTFALCTLEALTKQKPKAQDVSTALNVNVNHGVLFYVLRKAVAEMATEDSAESHEEDEWREALLSLLSSLPNSVARSGENMVSAGLFDILVEVLRLRTTKAERNHPKVLNFLDSFVHNLRDAFSALVNAKGLDVIGDLTAHEVEVAFSRAQKGEGMPQEYKTQLTDYMIPYYHQQTLRWLFKFMNHMLSHSSNNFARVLRNLIDSPQLLNGLRVVLGNASVFGSSVWSMAGNLLSNFIHTEPTSYNVIAEAGLSKGFLEAVTQKTIVTPEPSTSDAREVISSGAQDASPAAQPEDAELPKTEEDWKELLRPTAGPLAPGILPVAEAILVLPQAFGAICLNEQGMKLFKASDALRTFFEIFESPEHIAALTSDHESSGQLGHNFDELARHHPPLKSEIIQCVIRMVSQVGRLCYTRSALKGAGTKLWLDGNEGEILVAGGRRALSVGYYDQLESGARPDARPEDRATDPDVEMEDADIVQKEDSNRLSIKDVIDTEDPQVEPPTTHYVDVVCRFLSGFFQNSALCTSFADAGGLEFLLDLATLPSLPHDFNENGRLCDELTRVIAFVTEARPQLVITSLLQRIQAAVDNLEPLLNNQQNTAFFSAFTSKQEPSAFSWQQTHLQDGTTFAKALVNVQTLCHIISYLLHAPSYTHRSTQNNFNQVSLTDLYVRLVDSLGHLQRSCVWEHILLETNLPSAWKQATQAKEPGFALDEFDDSAAVTHNSNPDGDAGADNNREHDAKSKTVAESSSLQARDGKSSDRLDKSTARFRNIMTLRYLLHQVPKAITPFLQSLGRALLVRRTQDPYQKQNAVKIADQLAKTMIDHLTFSLPKSAASVRDYYSYLIEVLTSVAQLMMETGIDRTLAQSSAALTLVLQSFKNQLGFATVSEILELFFDKARSIVTRGDEQLSEDDHMLMTCALSGMKIILEVYAKICNGRVITEAAQTAAMQSRPDRDRDKPDFFLPAQFLVELRILVVKPTQKIWGSDLMDKATTDIVKTLISILRTILEGDSEQGAYKRTDKVPPRSKASPKTWKVRPEQLTRLKEDCDDEELACEALYRCCDNVASAREYCAAQSHFRHIARNPIPAYENQSQASPQPQPTQATGEPNSQSSSESPVAEPTSPDINEAETFQPIHVPRMESGFTPFSPEDSIAAIIRNAMLSSDGRSAQPAPTNGTEAGNVPDLVTIDDLDERRSHIRENLIARSLDVLNVHDDVTFELADLILAMVSKSADKSSTRAEIGATLVQSLISFQLEGGDFRPSGKKIAAYAHLLALVLQDKSIFDATLEELQNHFSILLEFVKIFSDQKPEESSPWVGNVLLIIEKLLSEDAQPQKISSDSPEDAQPIIEPPEPVIKQDQKQKLFEALIEVLPRIGKDEMLALSVTRTLVILTRNRQLAMQLSEKRNIQRLFLMVKQLAGFTNERVQSTFMLILRHIIEDDETIRHIMRSEIQAVFQNRSNRPLDTTSYTRQLHHLVLRQPDIFVQITNEMVMVLRYDSASRPQALVLKPESKEELEISSINGEGSKTEIGSPKATHASDELQSPQKAKEKEDPERSKASDHKHPVVDNPDGVIHYLLCELLTYKDVDDKEQTPREGTTGDVDMTNGSESLPMSAPPTTATEQKKNEKTEFKADQHPIYIYRCFLLQCLTELLGSYNRTKVEFINFSRKADPHTMTPSKPRSGILNYLLNTLIPVGTLGHADDLTFRKRYAVSNWAISVVVALCAKTGEHTYNALTDPPGPDDEPELIFVRKFVLEHAMKAFKDAQTSNEGLDMKYSRLMNLADVFHRMAVAKPSSHNANHRLEVDQLRSQVRLARIMYEKNFISVLTGAIADIDLNFPNARRVVKYILRPLRLLTQTAVEVSASSDSPTTPGTTDEDEISTASSVSDIDDEREETPDLYRNSTLAMFEPGRDDETESESDDDEDEDEIYGDEYADEMDFEQDLPPDDEDVVSEEDEPIPGDVPMELEVSVLGDEDEDITDEDDDTDGMDEDEDIEDDEALEVMDEINGDDENDSLAGDEDEEWASEDDEDYTTHTNIDAEHHSEVLDNIVRVIEGQDSDEALDRLEGELADMDEEDFMDDEMQEDDEDDDDEDDLEDDVMYEPGYDDDGDIEIDDMTMRWGYTGPMPAGAIRPVTQHDTIRLMSRNHPADRIIIPPGYRHHGHGRQPRVNDDGTNPLLQRSGRSASGSARGNRIESLNFVRGFEIDPAARGRFPPDTPSFIVNLLDSIGRAGGPGALFQQAAAGPLRFTFGVDTPFPPFEAIFRRDNRRLQEQPSRSSRDDPVSAVAFAPNLTVVRWQEEARLLFGPNAVEISQRVIEAILRLLVPPAREVQKRRERERQEQLRKEREEAEAREKKEREEREAREKEREERERAEAEAAAARERERAEAEQNRQVMQESEAAGEGQSMEGVEPSQPTATETAAAGPSESTPRISVTIRGRQLDITGLGIDLEYLEALPEELREEVILQQVQTQRQQATAAGEEPSDISREFLDALPPDIREELLQQEAQDRRRREREEARRRTAANGGPPRADDMDAATFIATLEPGLRQAVLLDQDEEMLAQLPEELVMEARALGGDRRLNQLNRRMDELHNRMNQLNEPYPHLNRPRGVARGDAGDEHVQKKSKPRPVVQMLDKAGVATLLRLMFIPQQGSARQSLNGVLRDVCENRQNRAEVISILLSILQDGSADISAVERSFAQLSLRAKQPATQKTPQPSRKAFAGQFPSNSEMSPLMVVQQCLSTLVWLTSYNQHVNSFFLSEHETAVGLRSRLSRKGKSKENKANRYPINALLALLDRKLIIESASVMEQLAQLLQSITTPLNILLKKDKEKQPEDEKKVQAAEDASGPPAPIDAPDQPSGPGDVVMSSPGDEIQPPGEAPDGAGTTTAASGPVTKDEKKSSEESGEKARKTRTLVPPEIPEHNLRLVVTILAARECSSKTFRDTLSVITNLSAIPGAKEVFGKELVRQAQDLGQSILRDLEELVIQISKAKTSTDVQAIALAKFSPSSSDQTKLLRVLTALDYLFNPRQTDTQDKPSNAQSEGLAADQKQDILTGLYESPTFGPLWAKLSECLTAIRRRGNMFNVATILLPLIEVLMVVCKNTLPKESVISKIEQKELLLSSPPPESCMENLFFTFTEEHRKILNDLVRHSPKLMSGSFALLVKNSKVLEFDNKRNYFNRRLHARATEHRHPVPPLQLSLRREEVFIDSFKSLFFRSADEMKYGKLTIRFHGEEGVDAGGVTREWFQVLARQMFNPDYALFVPVSSDKTTFHPNKNSAVNDEHLQYFKFIGRIIGKALYEGRVLDCHFSRAVYKRILGKPVSVKDMESLDLDYYKSLLWMLENDISDVLTETFSVESEVFGETQIIDLIPNGRNIAMTEENKHEYVRLVTEYRLIGSVKEQLEYFLMGFHDIVPAELISIFNEQELELLISGLPDIDVDDWKNNTEYHNYTAASPQIQWFWRAVRSFDKEERAKLLQFVTGTSKVPLNGFKELEGMNGFSRFNIHRDYGSKDRLPSSHTCFNQLDLPEYESYEILRERLYTAMTAGSEYFGFA